MEINKIFYQLDTAEGEQSQLCRRKTSDVYIKKGGLGAVVF